MTDYLRRTARIALGAIMLLAALPRPGSAQGVLSSQGLGFPQGQLSTQAISMGGATGESDPFSPLNPAALSLLPAPVVFSQVEPEYRRLTNGSVSQGSSIARFPIFMGALLFGSKWTGSLSASSLLDRTWQTTTRDSQVVGTDTVTGNLTQRSEGSISDMRLALAYQFTTWFRLGVGAHGYGGRVLLQTARTFDDTTFAADTQRTTIGFSGAAVSVGAEMAWARFMALGLTYRHGGSLNEYAGDVRVAGASAPDHFGASLLYLGLRGTTLAVRAAKDSWSRMEGLSPTMRVHEGLDVGIGGETTGPKFGSSPFSLRAGVRFRTLPFSLDATAVKERSLSAGTAFPLANGRVQFAFAAIRSQRTGSGSLSERAWTYSTAITVRP
jgi:hypothetical protein